MSYRELPDVGVAVAKGFLFAGVSAGIKSSGKRDLGMLTSQTHCTVAGVFTTNTAAAAPVVYSRSIARKGVARGVVVNSGCANACTGSRGDSDAKAMAAAAGEAVGGNLGDFLVCSTGTIGTYLPIEQVAGGVRDAVGQLGRAEDSLIESIMTTDTRPKRFAVTHADGWSIGGIAKGAAMIAPNMATMLSFLTTDADVPSEVLSKVLTSSTERSFNSITVDGQTSTNDSVLLFANGTSGTRPSVADFIAGVERVCMSLAHQIVSDGEGSTITMRVVVSGAAEAAEADAGARAVCNSLLVKASIHGRDPNWGRVVQALGATGVSFDLSKTTVKFGTVPILHKGTPGAADNIRIARDAIKAADEVVIEVDLGLGVGSAEVIGCDISPEYVRFNAQYES